MLSDFEREMCRNHKRMLDAQQTFQGQMAIKLAKAQYKDQEERERILKIYSGQVEPPVWPNQPKDVNHILQRYTNN